jgi:large subunit ribosomal protein L10
MDKATKQTLVAELVKDFSEVDSMFVADYRGLDVSAITELRSKLYEADANFRVVKNTLALRALKEAKVEGLDDFFQGPTAVAFVRGDAAAVAKALKDFAKTSGKLEMRGGLMDGAPVDADQVKEIANLPSREVILTMLVSAVNAPMAMVVGVLSAPTRDIVNVLDAYIEKRKAAGETE